MVKAILDGRKVQTRRQMKPQPALNDNPVAVDNSDIWVWGKTGLLINSPELKYKCPYGQVGDYLWVRETWRQAHDGSYEYYACPSLEENLLSNPKWKPSIHMPRAVSRITLQISNIRVERLQDITEQDAIDEGIEPREDLFDDEIEEWRQSWCNYINIEHCDKNKLWFYDPRKSFESLWVSINDRESWVQNPWVWIVEFTRC